ncbi:MAG TPA: ketol-acid reductoisomerase [Ignavibacteria bacterium]|nr:ketol-acid reductoisomerase [Bacteroidota bacterium]HRI85183.1 ketol-acid reductoisomerase [Ignavibacteria bacterium]HRK00606.1 ketol-acid reductoisomerase [Ignavibacteria bacterium]
MKLFLFFLFLSFSTFSISQSRYEKAIVSPNEIKDIINYEKSFSDNDSIPPPKDSLWFRYIPGSRNVLFTAPHATSQIRNGSIKQPDGGTGSLAVILNKLKNVPVLVTTYLSPSDPNYYDDNDFKRKLSQIVDSIKPIIVIDLHGSNPVRPYDVDFGTLNGLSFLGRKDLFDSLSYELSSNSLENQSLNFFSASTNQTITKFLYNKNIPCIQLEINSNYLSPDEGNIYSQKTAQLLQALLRFIEDVY